MGYVSFETNLDTFQHDHQAELLVSTVVGEVWWCYVCGAILERATNIKGYRLRYPDCCDSCEDQDD